MSDNSIKDIHTAYLIRSINLHNSLTSSFTSFFVCCKLIQTLSLNHFSDVNKFKGENVTMKCHNLEEHVIAVSLYTRHEAEIQVLNYYIKSKKLHLNDFYKRRLKAKFEGRDFTVDILNLQMKDAGSYWWRFTVLPPKSKNDQPGDFLVVRGK